MSVSPTRNVSCLKTGRSWVLSIIVSPAPKAGPVNEWALKNYVLKGQRRLRGQEGRVRDISRRMEARTMHVCVVRVHVEISKTLALERRPLPQLLE